MAELKTATIQDGNGGYIVINETDFDEESMELFVEVEDAPEEKPAPKRGGRRKKAEAE